VEYDILAPDGSAKAEGMKCGITRLHMENDAGKLTHRGSITLCDYNRAGTPLMEIVTEPDLRSAEEAVAFAQELRRILIAVNASEADMFKGMMRFDASISLREKGTQKLNPRSEIKNLNSFKALEKALQYEEKRLRALWDETGGPLKGNITVGWVDDAEKTRMLRDKEDAADYRYFPEPDIPPMTVSAEMIKEFGIALPALPREQKNAYKDMGLTGAEAVMLVDEPRLRERFDAIKEKTGDAKRASSLVLTQMTGFLNAQNKTLDEAPKTDALLELADAIAKGTISVNAGKTVLEKMIMTGKNASTIISEEGMGQISDASAIEKFVDEAIAANAEAIASFKAGKASALGAVVGWIMKQSKGQANPAKVQEILQKKIGA
jgi:aspartyl-tRNA(Asn)/glutamyl-tRNA(Gln) amidotransferase subunit B